MKAQIRPPQRISLALATCMILLSSEEANAFSQAIATGSGSNWNTYGGNEAEDHFSRLSQISDKNVERLGLAWFFDLDPMISSFSAPLAIDGTLYFAVGLSVVHAVSATDGKLLWRYDPKVAEVAGEKLRVAQGIRGIAYWQGKVITGTQDGRLIALDAKTGIPVWTVQTTQGPNDGRYITGAPRIFKGKVIIGHGGADFAAVRGYVTAYDAASGKQLWRFYTVPGDPAKNGSDKTMQMAARTWKGDWWKYGGGGTVWNAITYDAKFNTIYVGTGNGTPWNQNIRSPGGGDNLFVSSIVALDADTGEYRWHYQTNPGDTWDYDSATDMELATLYIDGRLRDVILHAPKNGFFYVIDRANGTLISAEPFVKVTWASGIDLATGRPKEIAGARFPMGEGMVQPGATGGHNWEPMAYSPQTRLVYIPTTELPGHFSSAGIDAANWRAAPHLQNNTGFNTLQIKDTPPVTHVPLGALVAWNPTTQKSAWMVPMKAPYNGGVATTAGNLVFQGNAEGRFVAYAADHGETLWSFDAHDGIVGQPITYVANGRQYVTIISGFSGIPAALGPQVAQFGWDYQTQSRRVLTFALDARLQLPNMVPVHAEAVVDDSKFVVDDALVNRGVTVYAAHCFSCHGITAVSGGGAPDLRHSSIPVDYSAFERVVRNGILQSGGMPSFQELSNDDLVALQNFIRYQARKDTRNNN